MKMENTVIRHKWAASGVSNYPLSHPVVGQRQFFETFRHFIHLVDNEAEEFAHVFAVIAQWGVGKSRLGYELVAQVNESSKGWFLRERKGELKNSGLFNDEPDREQYLALYIRYSQIANEYHNVDNWFAFGLYKSLLSLSSDSFDGSIQGQIAEESYNRLLVNGFEHQKMAAALQTAKHYTDEQLYTDQNLVTDLCLAAYEYLKSFGIRYVLVVLDELETAAEAATYGLESDELKKLDGRAIKLMGKAIKEEDPRRKLPWLRYVALCSPAIGDELRKIQSTARRFEMTELAANSFSDVSSFVQLLKEQRRLPGYNTGLVEAAYTMSAGNFGWFNVIMANVDSILEQQRIKNEPPPRTLGELFTVLVKSSNRIRDYVLDAAAIELVKVGDRSKLDVVRELLYGQLPVALQNYADSDIANLLDGRNEYDEPLALLYRRVEWDEHEAGLALSESKFVRERYYWRLSGVDQLLDLKQLLANLGTYAIHETGGALRSDGRHTLLLPLRQSEFVQLVSLLYPHPAADDAARALWRGLVKIEEFEPAEATHIGPGIAMIGRLDLRHRQIGQNTLVFRDPDMGEAHTGALNARKGLAEEHRIRAVLVGAMRVLDKNWQYDAVPWDFSRSGDNEKPVMIMTQAKNRSNQSGGLVSLDGLKLHPAGLLIMAWAKNTRELETICNLVSDKFSEWGRFPVVVFTSSRSLIDQFNAPNSELLKNASSYLLLYQLSSTEEHVLYQVGLPMDCWRGFALRESDLSSAYRDRLNSIVRSFLQSVTIWRRHLDMLGRIAWPLRPGGRLSDSDLSLLLKSWCYLQFQLEEPRSLCRIDETSDINVENLLALLPKLKISPRAFSAGYEEDERAVLFSGFDENALPCFPSFLVGLIHSLIVKKKTWTFDSAKREWFWAYTWDGAKEGQIYEQWMGLLCEMQFATEQDSEGRGPNKYAFLRTDTLNNLLVEANNWLNGDYQRIVGKMAEMFGEGRVIDLFAPLGAAKIGAKTALAKQYMAEAGECKAVLELKEQSVLFERPDSVEADLLICAGQRRKLLQRVCFVYERDQYQKLKRDDNQKILNFEDDIQPLWRRIRRAELFMEDINRQAALIQERKEELQAEIKAQVSDSFPSNLFILSLEKIAGIIGAALKSSVDPVGSTACLQVREPGTFCHYLRNLQVAEAVCMLEKIAVEVGLDLSGGRGLGLEEIEGHIIRSFRSLRKMYDEVHKSLRDYQGRLTAIENLVENAPADFCWPSDIPGPKTLSAKPGLIKEELEEVRADEVSSLLDEFDLPCKMGNFQPLMERALKLFDGPRRHCHELAGQIQTVENTIKEFLRSRLSRPEINDAYLALKTLRKARNLALPTEITLSCLQEKTSLQGVVDFISETVSAWNREGNELLQKSAVPFDRWVWVVKSITNGEEPNLEPQEAEALVQQGFLVHTYALTGGQP